MTTPALWREALEALEAHGGDKTAAARSLQLNRSTFRNRVAQAQINLPRMEAPPLYEVRPLPSADEPVDGLIDRLCTEFQRNDLAERARHLVPVRIRTAGPIGIAHFGDPHLDHSYGTNWPLLKRHVELVRQTEGMFGATVGDLSNNWVGRLAGLYGEQTTTRRQAWQLVEWFMNAVPWLYVVLGNHDVWNGNGELVDWMTRSRPGVLEPHGVRLNLQFPNGREVRVNARHDFRGHSMWNPAHGPAKAAQMGWRDHILTCGHKHVVGYEPIACPMTGIISHAIRVGSYKQIDGYAKEKGFMPGQNWSPCAVTIIDPDAQNEVDLVTVLWSMEHAAKYLTWLRSR